MALAHSPSITRTGLVQTVDAANVKSYSGSGTTWTDLSSNLKDLTLTASPTYTSGSAGYFTFNGSSQYAINSSFSSHQTSAGTLSLWAYPTTTSGDLYAIAVGGTATYGASRAIRINNGFWCAVNYGSSTEDLNNIVAADANTWVNIVYVWNGTTITYYKNAVSSSGTRSGMVTPTGTTLTVGATAWSPIYGFWPGRISNVSVYNVALTSNQVENNFQALRGRYGI